MTPNVLMLLEHVLRGADHDVDLAATVQQARSYLGKHRYDLVVADGKLPDGTGMAVGDAASAVGIETLIITGYALHLPREELMRFEYLLKPLRPIELLNAIERKLDPAPPVVVPQ